MIEVRNLVKSYASRDRRGRRANGAEIRPAQEAAGRPHNSDPHQYQ
jgi:hypothetical protein